MMSKEFPLKFVRRMKFRLRKCFRRLSVNRLCRTKIFINDFSKAKNMLITCNVTDDHQRQLVSNTSRNWWSEIVDGQASSFERSFGSQKSQTSFDAKNTQFLHTALIIREFFVKSSTYIVLHLPYSPDLTQCVFRLFLTLFEYYSEKRLLLSFEIWEICCNKYIVLEGDCILQQNSLF